MTKQTFVKFAKMLKNAKGDPNNDLGTILRIQDEIVKIFEEANKMFDAARFEDAAL